MSATERTIKTMELINRARGHDPSAFTELMQIYMKDMYRTASAILMNDNDAADAVSETILVCWEKIDTLKEEKYFKTWMTRILINKCYDILKRNKKVVSFEECAEISTTDSSDLEFYEMLSSLDEKYRLPLMLYYGQGYKTGEIAKILHIPKSTVLTRLKRGRDKLALFYGSERD